MSRTVRKQLFSTLDTLAKANRVLHKLLLNGKTENAASLLVECQECAIAIGTQIDEVYGEYTETVHALEDYCELVYLLSENLSSYAQREQIYAQICEHTEQIGSIMQQEIPDRLEVVFLPYKASMWDSLESVYLAAAADENCDAYVIPIPYFDRNSDRSLGEMHYEGDEYPEEIPVTDWQAYDFAQRRPDMVFIHNPYDGYNFVTSVHPFFYSENLKQYTDTLVYIPYYTTSGGMSEARSQCSAYYQADYIVIQAEKYRYFFDANLPEEKFLAMGSPKFDRVIRMCENPPEIPACWREKMAGKKVYFYNTSIGGMLANTPAFLEKMKYVFECFAEREDACLLWRPHPLLESSFDSMRAEVKPIYDALKRYFFESGLGIYDDTADVTRAVALSDAYIGDAASSVVSMFGVAGKPIFILDNTIHTKPEADDWRGQIIKTPTVTGNRDWIIAQGNKLYCAKNSDYKYSYFCDLSPFAEDTLYLQVTTVAGKNYVCPRSARHIIELNETGIERRIELKPLGQQLSSFYGAVGCGQYLFLVPDNYPAIVRYDTVSGEITYLTPWRQVHRKEVQGAMRLGGFCAHKDRVYLTSPIDNEVLRIHAHTGEMQVQTLPIDCRCGCACIISEGEELWLLPYNGTTIVRWNPESGEVREYGDVPDGLLCKHPVLGYEIKVSPFGIPAFQGRYVYFPPCFGNMYVRLDQETGQMHEWVPSFEQPKQVKNEYYRCAARAHFVRTSEKEDGHKVIFSVYDRKMYDVNLVTGENGEILLNFDEEELAQQEPGFCEQSEWLQYACPENAFNSLSDFLSGNITGNCFDRERQIRGYSTIAVNHDGTCGEKVYQYMKEQADRR